jgi:hypothetical protein
VYFNTDLRSQGAPIGGRQGVLRMLDLFEIMVDGANSRGLTTCMRRSGVARYVKVVRAGVPENMVEESALYKAMDDGVFPSSDRRNLFVFDPTDLDSDIDQHIEFLERCASFRSGLKWLA